MLIIQRMFVCFVDYNKVLNFSRWIFRTMNDLIGNSQGEVVYLLLSICEQLHVEGKSFNFLDETSEELVSAIQCCLRGTVTNWIRLINDIVAGDTSSTQVHESDLALLWGTVNCFPYVFGFEADSSLLIDLRGALDQLLMAETGMAPCVYYLQIFWNLVV